MLILWKWKNGLEILKVIIIKSNGGKTNGKQRNHSFY